MNTNIVETLPTGIVYDDIYLRHDTGEGHPESPARLKAVMAGIRAAVPAGRRTDIPARRATDGDVRMCHSADYLAIVKRDVAEGLDTLSTGDTHIGSNSYDVALWAVGGVMAAVDAVMTGTVRNAFCAVRPPGHHAEGERGMGFCVFNNIAIGARYAQKQHGIKRVLVVDWDVHHGNGTQAIFYEDPTVFYFSTHQWPLYPRTGRADETGRGAGKGFTLNVPLRAGSGGVECIQAFREKLVPAMKSFRPELVMVSAGFDGAKGDPIANLELSAADFAALTGILMDIAREYAQGRLVSVLEGGYDLDNLRECAGAHVQRMAGEER